MPDRLARHRRRWCWRRGAERSVGDIVADGVVDQRARPQNGHEHAGDHAADDNSASARRHLGRRREIFCLRSSTVMRMIVWGSGPRLFEIALLISGAVAEPRRCSGEHFGRFTGCPPAHRGCGATRCIPQLLRRGLWPRSRYTAALGRLDQRRRASSCSRPVQGRRPGVLVRTSGAGFPDLGTGRAAAPGVSSARSVTPVAGLLRDPALRLCGCDADRPLRSAQRGRRAMRRAAPEIHHCR